MKRILLKLSGEALAGLDKKGLNDEVLKEIAQIVKILADEGKEIALVIGGGNFWRGRSSGDMDRVTADYIGMLATTMNALAMADALQQHGAKTAVLSALDIPKIHELFDKQRALAHLQAGKIILCAGGTGNPFFSTDSTAALRAAELEADLVLKATLVDGVYDKDPHKHTEAKMFESLSYDEVLAKGLAVIDASAAAICRDNGLKMRIFNINPAENILAAARGEEIGTLLHA